jgi:hypothetical protein
LNAVKSWRIHFGWAIVTVLAVAVTARIAPRTNPEPPKALPRSAVAALPKEAPQGRDRPGSELLPEPPVAAPPAPSPADEKKALADKIRRMLGTAQAMDEVQELMAGIEDREFKLTLLKEALAGKDQQAVYSALAVLRSMKSRDVAELIESYLAAHLSDETGFVAAYSLGELGDPGSIAALNDALRAENDEVRIYSAQALMKMGYRAPADQMLSELAQDYESADGAIRRKAVTRIGRLALEGGVPVLARALKDSNGDVRLQALVAFSMLGKQEYLPLLQPLTQDGNSEVSKTAQQVIENLKERP